MKTKRSLAQKHVKRIMKNRLFYDGYYLKWVIVLVAIVSANWVLKVRTNAEIEELVLATVWLCICCALLMQSFLCKGFAELMDEKDKETEPPIES